MNYRNYVKMGFQVFPVAGPIYAEQPDEYKTWKKPLVTWTPYQTRVPTEAEIVSWEKQWPGAWIGCATGPVANLFVIDIDGEKGMSSFARLNYHVPITRIAKTRRGFHYFFRWNKRLDQYVTNTSNREPGIDVRGKGGYVVLPSGQEDREWKITDDPVDLPEDWYKILSHSETEKKPISVSEKLDGLEEGNRHDTFMRLVGKLMHSKMNATEIIATLSPLAQQHNFQAEFIDLVRDMFSRYQRTSIKMESMSVLLSEPEPPLVWRIDGLWTDQSRGLIAGTPGIGKTWLALDMLLSVSSGLPCLGKYSVTQAPTLLIEEEASRHNMARRIHALARGRGIRDADIKSLFHITRQLITVPKDINEIMDLINSNGVKMVVFDSLRRVHGANENSSEEMRPVLNAFSSIVENCQCSVILIHHLSKSSNDKGIKKPIFERMRGTSDLWAWRDCVLGIEGEEGESYSTCSFQFRDAESPNQIKIKRTVDEQTGAITLSCVSLTESPDFLIKANAMIAYMKEQGISLSKDQIVSKSGGRKQENSRIFEVMGKQKMVVQDGFKWIVPITYGTNGNDRNV